MEGWMDGRMDGCLGGRIYANICKSMKIEPNVFPEPSGGKSYALNSILRVPTRTIAMAMNGDGGGGGESGEDDDLMMIVMMMVMMTMTIITSWW